VPPALDVGETPGRLLQYRVRGGEKWSSEVAYGCTVYGPYRGTVPYVQSVLVAGVRRTVLYGCCTVGLNRTLCCSAWSRFV